MKIERGEKKQRELRLKERDLPNSPLMKKRERERKEKLPSELRRKKKEEESRKKGTEEQERKQPCKISGEKRRLRDKD